MKNKFTQQNHFWVSNITKKTVNLSDLNVIIYPLRSINLLDNKHNTLTIEQLNKSSLSGSIKNKYKSKSIIIRMNPPDIYKEILPFEDKAIFPTKQRSAVELENIKYEELNISDDEYATDNAELAEKDHLGKWGK